MPLRIACRTGDLENVKMLVENGADIYNGEIFCLSLACHHGHFEIVKYLVSIIDRDVKLGLITYKYSRSSCHHCMNAESENHMDIYRYLVKLNFKHGSEIKGNCTLIHVNFGILIFIYNI